MQHLLSLPIEAWLGALAFIFFLGLVAFIVFAALVVKSYRTLRGEAVKHEITPQPLITRRDDPFATQSELAQVKEDISAIDDDLKSLRHEIVVNGEARRQSIESKVEYVRVENLNHVEAVRVELGGKIDGMEGRIIATLKNTGAI